MGDLILAPNSKASGTPCFDMFANALRSSHPKLDFARADRASAWEFGHTPVWLLSELERSS
jgi:hypothetical protein